MTMPPAGSADITTTDEGIQLLQRGDAAGAARLLMDAIEENPADGRAFQFLGIARIQSGDAEGGLAALREAGRLQPQNGGVQFNLGVALMQAGHNEDAKAALQKAVNLDPNNSRARAALEQLAPAATGPTAAPMLSSVGGGMPGLGAVGGSPAAPAAPAPAAAAPAASPAPMLSSVGGGLSGVGGPPQSAPPAPSVPSLVSAGGAGALGSVGGSGAGAPASPGGGPVAPPPSVAPVAAPPPAAAPPTSGYLGPQQRAAMNDGSGSSAANVTARPAGKARSGGFPILAVLGGLVFVAGVVLWCGNVFGFLRTFSGVGYITMIAGGFLFKMGSSEAHDGANEE